MNARELRDKRTMVLNQAKALNDKAESENRDLTADEQKSYDDLLSEAESLEKRYTRVESLETGTVEPPAKRSMPNINMDGNGQQFDQYAGQYGRVDNADGKNRQFRHA